MRERLTKRKDLISCETCDDEFCQICDQATDAINRLAEYEDLEEQGLLVKLPCKVGDKVYLALDGCKVSAITTVYQIEINSKGILINGMLFGTTVFLTRAEAEKKLKELKGKEQ